MREREEQVSEGAAKMGDAKEESRQKCSIECKCTSTAARRSRQLSRGADSRRSVRTGSLNSVRKTHEGVFRDIIS